MSSDKKEKSRLDIARETWNDFLLFLYNKDEGTVLGRNGNSWSKILVFYMFYYGFLACLFAASISIVLSTLSDYTPKYQTRLQTPGVAIQPKTPSDIEQTSNIKYNLKNYQDNAGYQRLTLQMEKFLYPYATVNQTDNEVFQDCIMTQPPSTNQNFEKDQIAKSCRFDITKLGPCSVKPYGYDKGQPCIFVKVNRIIGWYPVGYTNLSRAVGNSQSDAPPLSDVLATYGQSYQPYLMYTHCYGDEPEDKNNLGGTLDTKYFPTHMGIPFVYFPYAGKKRQPAYINPIVAVQFTNVTKNVDITIKCKVYALNIRDNKEMGEGYFKFDMRIDDKE
ncbi:sodium/potassium-transporting ATPase subunit beta-1-like isoform X1 [Styela clava]